MPTLLVIAGPNGAGKTTYAREFVPKEIACREFVNADLIAAGLSPFAAESATFEAGRAVLRRVRELAARRQDFSIETTLSGRTYLPLFRRMRDDGYGIHLDFLWVSTLEIAKRRIRARVRQGGHAIPDEVQRRRFGVGLCNALALYRPLLHRFRLFDNSGAAPVLVFEERDGRFIVGDPARLANVERISKVRLMPSSTEGVEEPGASFEDRYTRGGLRALRRAAATAILENLRHGLPIAQWREDKGLVEVPAELLAPFARRVLDTNGDPLPEAEEQALLKPASDFIDQVSRPV